MIEHKGIGIDKHGNNITLCGSQGATASPNRCVTCNKCRSKLHMKKIATEKQVTPLQEKGKESVKDALPHNCFHCEVGGISCSYAYGSKGCLEMNSEIIL